MDPTMDQEAQTHYGQDSLIQELREGMLGMQQMIVAMRTEMQHLRTQQPQAAHPPEQLREERAQEQDIAKRPRPKLPGLTEFDGKRSNWDQWHMKANLKLRVDGDSIGSPLDQLAYLYSCLKDDAAKTIHAYCMACFESGNGTGNALLEHMDTSYGDPNKRERALQDLHNLEQKERENFATFLPKFETLLANAGGAEYSDDQRIAYLKQSLNQEFREKLVGLSSLLPKGYPAFVSYLQTIGSEITGLRLLNKNKEKKPDRTQQRASEPMDWEPTTKTTHIIKANSKRANWISQDTYNTRMKNRLCLRCGNDNHLVKDCTLLPPLKLQATYANKARTKEEDDSDIESVTSDVQGKD
jgi:hypothetical protein